MRSLALSVPLASFSFVASFAWELSSSAAVSPVDKVITLLEDLKAQVVEEGKEEATSYAEFACFCKKTTEEKSGYITSGKDSIDSLSASIEENTAKSAEDETELQGRKSKQEEDTKELEEEKARCEGEASKYEANAGDLKKAIAGLEGAIASLQDSKTAAGLLATRATIQKSMDLAEAMNLISAPKFSAVQAFLQQGVDPENPEYKYHSQGIIDTLQKLLKEFKDEKSSVDDEWKKTAQACEDAKASISLKLDENGAAIKSLNQALETLKGDTAEDRQDLIGLEVELKDDQLYLKDLTERCEARAKDWDQRSQMRAGEVEALAGALTVMTDKVQSLDTDVNKRALLQREETSRGKVLITRSATVSNKEARQHPEAKASKGLLFLQEEVSTRSLSQAERQQKVATLLLGVGKQVKSAFLTSVAMRASADPFAKVKKLIQELVERLLNEANAETTKKGFCDTELGKAEKDRKFRLDETKALDAEIGGLKVKIDELTAENSMLEEELPEIRTNLQNATAMRAEEKQTNEEIVKKAKEGSEAVAMALTLLKSFYKTASKAASLAQKASPVDEDTTGPGFKGAYRGNQAASKGVIGMLEVIKSDFDRTVQQTQAAEKRAASDYVEFDRTSRSDISAKETKLELNQEDLANAEASAQRKLADLKTEMDLLDASLKVIENLKPTCIDTGMSYEERAQKRQDEIAALKKALCILDSNGVEPECQD